MNFLTHKFIPRTKKKKKKKDDDFSPRWAGSRDANPMIRINMAHF